MCTVIVEVPERPEYASRLLAVRDEHPERQWDPPGRWWPETHPGVRGVRDRLAGGAWLAADNGGALSVILNRAESVAALVPENAPARKSRGSIVLDSIAGKKLPEHPHTESFNLVEVQGSRVVLTTWNGRELQQQDLAPGVHMVAHGSVNSGESARINRWLPEFQQLAGIGDARWRDAWLATLTESAELPPGDDRAIIRDNTPHGFPTKSLLVSFAEIWSTHVMIESATLAEPSKWAGEAFIAAL